MSQIFYWADKARKWLEIDFMLNNCMDIQTKENAILFMNLVKKSHLLPKIYKDIWYLIIRELTFVLKKQPKQEHKFLKWITDWCRNPSQQRINPLIISHCYPCFEFHRYCKTNERCCERYNNECYKQWICRWCKKKGHSNPFSGLCRSLQREYNMKEYDDYLYTETRHLQKSDTTHNDNTFRVTLHRNWDLFMGLIIPNKVLKKIKQISLLVDYRPDDPDPDDRVKCEFDLKNPLNVSVHYHLLNSTTQTELLYQTPDLPAVPLVALQYCTSQLIFKVKDHQIGILDDIKILGVWIMGDRYKMLLRTSHQINPGKLNCIRISSGMIGYQFPPRWNNN